MVGEEEEMQNAKKQVLSPVPMPSLAPVATQAPVPPPTLAPTEATQTPTESIFDFVSSLLGDASLLEPDTIAYKAAIWLEENRKLGNFDNQRLKQRFALACLYYSTNKASTWIEQDKWMSDKSECKWYGVRCEENNLVSLNLAANGLEGLVPWEITFLKDTLLALDLSENDLTNQGQELAWIGELDKLRLLDIQQTQFAHDGVPHYISKLTDLQMLHLGDSLFSGDLDGSLFEPLTQLLLLDIGGNMFNSTIPSEITNLPKLEALYAYDTGLRGDLNFMANMGSIFELWLDDNPGLTGTLPSEIGTLTTMASLSVSNCNLEGQIPTEIGLLTGTQQMWFFGNWFSGSVPTEIGKLANLKILGLEDNNITNVVMPQEVCDMNLIALSADCSGSYDFMDCECCTCCEAPCPVANLPIYEQGRKLQIVEEIQRL